MIWAIFGILIALLVLSIILDIDNSQKYDGEGIGKRTVLFALLLVLLGVAYEFIQAIDPLM